MAEWLGIEMEVWSTIGTWASAIAMFLAVVVSLYLASSSRRIRLKAVPKIRKVIGGDHCAMLDIYNIGEKRTNIPSWGIHPVGGNHVEIGSMDTPLDAYCTKTDTGPFSEDFFNESGISQKGSKIDLDKKIRFYIEDGSGKIHYVFHTMTYKETAERMNDEHASHEPF